MWHFALGIGLIFFRGSSEVLAAASCSASADVMLRCGLLVLFSAQLQFLTDWKGWNNKSHVPGLCKELSVEFGVLWERGDPPSLHWNSLHSIQCVTAPSSWQLNIFKSSSICLFWRSWEHFLLGPWGWEFYLMCWCIVLYSEPRNAPVCSSSEGVLSVISLVVCQVMNPSSEHMGRHRNSMLKSNNSFFLSLKKKK